MTPEQAKTNVDDETTSPHAGIAIQDSTVDVTRRLPSYNSRLTKASPRKFEIYVPNPMLDDMYHTAIAHIFEQAIMRIRGLARLLVLVTQGVPREAGRPLRTVELYPGDITAEAVWLSNVTQRKNYLNATVGCKDTEYETASRKISCGPGWDANRIERLI
ncbi:hypothetical protein OF83DRAFT_1089650 [Amylostereum chailletii]|nr:hypothetical protein OF83DRAFT_1089650 [Amylostereum chailletii]